MSRHGPPKFLPLPEPEPVPQICSDLLSLGPPPTERGWDAVLAWVGDVNLILLEEVQQDPLSPRLRCLQAIISAIGRVRRTAGDVELSLVAREQREDTPWRDLVSGTSPPGDLLALPLWHAHQIAALLWDVARAADFGEDAAPVAASRCRAHVDGVAVRERGTGDELKYRHRIRDVGRAVRDHEAASQRLQEEELDEEVVRQARDSLLVYACYMRRGYQTPPHIQIIAAKLEAVERGEIRRLVITVPPRHGKSQQCAHHFPAWYFGRHPDRDVILASLSQTRADDAGREIRNDLGSVEFSRVFPGIHVSGDSSAVSRFHVEDDSAGHRQRRGEFHAYGRGASPTGMGAHLLIIDDLVGEDEIDSPAAWKEARTMVGALRSRLAPRAPWIALNTRYAEDDVVGYVLDTYGDDGPWEHVNLTQLAEEDEEHLLPSGETWRRAKDTALWEEQYSTQEMRELRSHLLRVNPRAWWGQRQGRPVPQEGALINVPGWFRRYANREEVLSRARRVTVSVDTSKGGAGARNAITVWAELEWGPDGGAYLAEVQAEPWAYPILRDHVKEVCGTYRPHVLLIEDKSTGEALIPDLRNAGDWVRTPIVAVHPTSDKVTRMSVCTPQMRDGQVWLPERGSRWAPWLADFEKELTYFPQSKWKDQSDSTSQYLNWRRENPLQPGGGALPWTARGGEALDQPKVDLLRALGGPWGRRGAGLGGGRRLG